MGFYLLLFGFVKKIRVKNIQNKSHCKKCKQKCTQKCKKCPHKWTHKKLKTHKNAKNDTSFLTDLLPGWRGRDIVSVRSKLNIGYPRCYRDICDQFDPILLHALSGLSAYEWTVPCPTQTACQKGNPYMCVRTHVHSLVLSRNVQSTHAFHWWQNAGARDHCAKISRKAPGSSDHANNRSNFSRWAAPAVCLRACPFFLSFLGVCALGTCAMLPMQLMLLVIQRRDSS